jgi:hypothetical protein
MLKRCLLAEKIRSEGSQELTPRNSIGGAIISLPCLKSEQRQRDALQVMNNEVGIPNGYTELLSDIMRINRNQCFLARFAVLFLSKETRAGREVWQHVALPGFEYVVLCGYNIS